MKSKKIKVIIFIGFLILFALSFWRLYTLMLKNTDAGKIQKEMQEKRDSAHQGLPELKD